MTFMPWPLSRAKITDALLDDLTLKKKAFFGRDGVYHYAMMPTMVYKLEIVRKTKEVKFSQIIQGLPAEFQVVVNGNYFSCVSRGCYYTAGLGDVATPDETNSIGDVIQSGSVALPDMGDGDLFAYFGRTQGTTATDYCHGMGNPPVPFVYEGAGGLGPLILTNPATCKPYATASETSMKRAIAAHPQAIQGSSGRIVRSATTTPTSA